MTDRRQVLRMTRWTLAAVLAGGSLFGGCEVQLKDAMVSASKDFLRSLLDPTNVLEPLSLESSSPFTTP